MAQGRFDDAEPVLQEAMDKVVCVCSMCVCGGGRGQVCVCVGGKCVYSVVHECVRVCVCACLRTSGVLSITPKKFWLT